MHDWKYSFKSDTKIFDQKNTVTGMRKGKNNRKSCVKNIHMLYYTEETGDIYAEKLYFKCILFIGKKQ